MRKNVAIFLIMSFVLNFISHSNLFPILTVYGDDQIEGRNVGFAIQKEQINIYFMNDGKNAVEKVFEDVKFEDDNGRPPEAFSWRSKSERFKVKNLDEVEFLLIPYNYFVGRSSDDRINLVFAKYNNKDYVSVNSVIATKGTKITSGENYLFPFILPEDIDKNLQRGMLFVPVEGLEINLLYPLLFIQNDPDMMWKNFQTGVDGVGVVFFKKEVDGVKIILPTSTYNTNKYNKLMNDFKTSSKVLDFYGLGKSLIESVEPITLNNSFYKMINDEFFKDVDLSKDSFLITLEDYSGPDNGTRMQKQYEIVEEVEFKSSIQSDEKIIGRYIIQFDKEIPEIIAGLTNQEEVERKVKEYLISDDYILNYIPKNFVDLGGFRKNLKEQYIYAKGTDFEFVRMESSLFGSGFRIVIKRKGTELSQISDLDSIDENSIIITYHPNYNDNSKNSGSREDDENKYTGFVIERNHDSVILDDTVHSYIKTFINHPGDFATYVGDDSLTGLLFQNLATTGFGEEVLSFLSGIQLDFTTGVAGNIKKKGIEKTNFKNEIERLKNLKNKDIEAIYNSNLFNVNNFIAEPFTYAYLPYFFNTMYGWFYTGLPIKLNLKDEVKDVLKGNPTLDYSKEYKRYGLSFKDFLPNMEGISDSTLLRLYDYEGNKIKGSVSFFHNSNYLYDSKFKVLHVLEENLNFADRNEVNVKFYLVKNGKPHELLTEKVMPIDKLSRGLDGRAKNLEVGFQPGRLEEDINGFTPAETEAPIDSSFLTSMIYSSPIQRNVDGQVSKTIPVQKVENNQFMSYQILEHNGKKYRIIFTNVLDNEILAFVVEDLSSYAEHGDTTFEMQYNPYDFYSKYEIGENVPKYTIKSRNPLDGLYMNYWKENNPKINTGSFVIGNFDSDLYKKILGEEFTNIDGNDSFGKNLMKFQITNGIGIDYANPIISVSSIGGYLDILREGNKMLFTKIFESGRRDLISDEIDIFGNKMKTYDFFKELYKKENQTPVDFYILCDNKPYITTKYKDNFSDSVRAQYKYVPFMYLIDKYSKKIIPDDLSDDVKAVLGMWQSTIFNVFPDTPYLDYAKNLIENEDIYSYRLNLISAPLSYEDGYSHDFLVNATKFVGNTFAHNLIDKVQFRMNLPFSTADIMPEFDRYITDHTYITYERDVNEPNKITFQANFTTYDEDSKMGRIVQSYAIKQGITEAYYDLYGELFKKTITFDPSITIKDEEIERWLDSEVPFEYKRTENYCSDCLYSYNDKLENQAKPNLKIIDPLKEWEKLVQPNPNHPKNKIKKRIKNVITVEKEKTSEKDFNNLTKEEELKIKNEIDEYIKKYLQQNPFIIGFEDKTVKVEKPLTLSEFAAMMNRLDTGKMEKTTKGEKWYKEVIDKLNKDNVLGYKISNKQAETNISEKDFQKILEYYKKFDSSNKNIFENKKTITRGETIKILHNLYNRKLFENKSVNVFKDLSKNNLYYDLIMSSFYKFLY